MVSTRRRVYRARSIEKRVFGCALFGVVGGHVYFHARGRVKVLGMHVANEDGEDEEFECG